MINSIRFPKLTFKNAPTLSPISWAMHSVAKDNIPDSGITARAFDVNIIEGSALARYVINPTGTNTSRRLIHE
jgi:hypothetical protein